MASAEEGGLKLKPLTGWSYLAGSGHKTEEDHLNIEKLTGVLGYNAYIQ